MMVTSSSNASELMEWSMPLVLVTEDDEIYQQMVCETLKQSGYRVIQAGNGHDCLSAYLRYAPDLVLLDLEMPEMDGFQCLQQLRSLAGNTLSPVLIMSTLIQPDVMEQAFAAGATDYVTKPLDWPILKQRIHHILQNRRAIADLNHQLELARVASMELETQLQKQASAHAKCCEMADARIADLEQLNQLKDHHLNRMSHELRSPLTNMSLAIAMLEQQFHFILAQKETALFLRINLEKILTYLEILSRQCKREIKLINNLLDLQLLDAGRHPLSAELVNLTEWLPAVVEPFWDRARERQQHLQLLAMPDLPVIQTDPVVLERIVTELLTNACKYAPLQARIGITVQEVVIEPLEPDSSTICKVVQISVSNTCTEIPAEALSQIFEPFYRVPRSDLGQQGGTGLGLALVQRMVHHLGGTIQVRSFLNQTLFTVELPSTPMPD